MRKGLVGLRHTVHVRPRLDGRPLTFVGVNELLSEGFTHPLALLTTRGLTKPAKRERLLTLPIHRHRNLIVAASHAFGTHLDIGSRILECLLKDFVRRNICYAFRNDIEGVIHQARGRTLLAAEHQTVDEFRNQNAVVPSVRLQLRCRVCEFLVTHNLNLTTVRNRVAVDAP